MSDTPARPELPDHLSIDSRSPFYKPEVFEHDIGIRFNGKERKDVEEYCLSEGWVKVPAGKNAKSSPKIDNKVQHAKQKATLDNHRSVKNVKKEDVIIAPVRPKLQFFTIENVHEFLKAHKKGGSKLNLWVPDEERKARELSLIHI